VNGHQAENSKFDFNLPSTQHHGSESGGSRDGRHGLSKYGNQPKSFNSFLAV